MRRYTAVDIPTMAQINALPKRWVGASLFAGCGGASTGLKLARVDVRFASEFIPGAARTYRANAPDTVVDDRDVRKLTGRDVMRACGVRRGELDWLDGSPPCKMFSSAGRHGRLGKKADDSVLYSEGVWQRVDDLFDHHVRLVREIRPRITCIENVPGLTQSSSRGVFVYICDSIQKAGYRLEVRIIDPSHLGVPQARRRLVFLGIRDDLYARGLRHAWPQPYPGRQVGIRDVLPNVRRVCLGTSDQRTKWRSAALPGPTLTVASCDADQFSVMSAPPHYEDDHGDLHKYDIRQLVRIFGFPHDFVLGGAYRHRYERLARSHAPLAVYNVAGTQLLEMDRILGRKR